MKKLYYVVEKQLSQIDDEIEETNGWKTINVYEPVVEPKNFSLNEYCSFECKNIHNTEEKILEWIDENNPDEEEIKLIQL